MTNRYKTKAEREGHKRRVKAYRERLIAQGLKPRQIWMTDQENDYMKTLLAHWRGELIDQTDGTLDGNLQTLFFYSMGRLTRKEAREALGVDDFHLTQLLRMAGFPPPRSPKSDEDAQVEMALKILNESEAGER